MDLTRSSGSIGHNSDDMGVSTKRKANIDPIYHNPFLRTATAKQGPFILGNHHTRCRSLEKCSPGVEKDHLEGERYENHSSAIRNAEYLKAIEMRSFLRSRF